MTDATFASEFRRPRAERVSIRRHEDAAVADAAAQHAAVRRVEYLIIAGQLAALAIILPIVVILGDRLPW
jgi:hypothetical protein